MSKFLKKCVPKCGKSKEPSGEGAQLAPAVEATIPVACLKCGLAERIVANQSSFVCKNCHRVHRVADSGGVRKLSIANDGSSSGEIYSLQRLSSSAYICGEKDVLSENPQMVGSSIVATGPAAIPVCSVCMDGPGDVVLLPCAHGAICEPCAKHISRNMSVGGSHCPKCRQPISRIVRVSELDGVAAKGIAISVPESEIRKNGPPRVPPPPGLNKEKNGSH